MRVIVALFLLFGTFSSAFGESIAIINLADTSPAVSSAVSTLKSKLIAAGWTLANFRDTRITLEAPAARPAPIAEQTLSLIAQARSHYESFEYPAALALLEQVDRSSLLAPHSSAILRPLSDRFLLSGLIALARGNQREAVRDFRLSHRLWSRRSELDAGAHRPRTVAAFRAAVEANEAAVFHEPLLTVHPIDAQVRIDGAADAPSARVPEGPHRIVVTSLGHSPQSRIIHVGKNVERVTITLVPLSVSETVSALKQAAVAMGGPSVTQAKRLATLIRTQHLAFLSRNGDDFRVTLFYSDSARLEAPIGLHTAQLTAALALPSDGAVIGKQLPNVATSESTPPWYRKWWGVSLLAVGVGAALGTGAYFAFMRDDSPKTTIGWCFDGC